MHVDILSVGWVLPGICFFFFNDTATTEIYTLSLHDALPISTKRDSQMQRDLAAPKDSTAVTENTSRASGPEDSEEDDRSEEHTSELQSPDHLVCRLLLEKKDKLESSQVEWLRVLDA